LAANHGDDILAEGEDDIYNKNKNNTVWLWMINGGGKIVV
jgi:hypothetical protein